jgi:single-strand DNA-binding protein
LDNKRLFFWPPRTFASSIAEQLSRGQKQKTIFNHLNFTVMKSLRNSVQLIGRLGKDVEVKDFDKSKKASFTMATTDSYKNAKGEKVEDTQWHNIVIWGQLADVAGKYLKKGSEVCVEGKLVHRNYETDKGEKRYITEINVSDLVLMGGKQN